MSPSRVWDFLVFKIKIILSFLFRNYQDITWGHGLDTRLRCFVIFIQKIIMLLLHFREYRLDVRECQFLINEKMKNLWNCWSIVDCDDKLTLLIIIMKSGGFLMLLLLYIMMIGPI